MTYEQFTKFIEIHNGFYDMIIKYGKLGIDIYYPDNSLEKYFQDMTFLFLRDKLNETQEDLLFLYIFDWEEGKSDDPDMPEYAKDPRLMYDEIMKYNFGEELLNEKAMYLAKSGNYIEFGNTVSESIDKLEENKEACVSFDLEVYKLTKINILALSL